MTDVCEHAQGEVCAEEAASLHLTVHVGMHKSGSTAIQVAAARAADSLVAQGVYYPVNLFASIPDQHSEIAINLRARRRGVVSSALRRAAKDARARGAHTIFLSGEELCKMSAAQIRHFKRLVAQNFTSWSFVFVVRNLEDYLLSTFKHYLRFDDGRCTFSDVLRKENVLPERVVDLWKGNFSPDRIIISYDDIRDELVPRFFGLVFSLDLNENPRENYSLDLLVLNIFNTLLKDWRGPELDAFMWDFVNNYPSNDRYAMEQEVKVALAAAMPKHGWNVDDLPPGALRRPTSAIVSDFDPIAVSDRMIAFFQLLRSFFEKRQGHRVAE